MFDDYLLEQPIAYKMIKNAINKNKLSHAYLIEANGYKHKKQFALALAKTILCPKNYSNNTKCVNCTQCQNIEKNIYEDLKIIEPNGLWIKKEQLIELQNSFMTKSVQSGKKIYIITDATKLNTASANLILKFLEEPNPNIIAILISDNIHQLLDTIVSRCQILPLNSIIEKNKIENYLSIESENIELIKTTVVNFINKIEEKKEVVLLHTKKLFHNNIIEKNDLIAAFEIMILYYKDALNLKINKPAEIFEIIDPIILNNTKDEISEKINKLLDLKRKIYINANTNLLIDRLVIELGGKNENSRN